MKTIIVAACYGAIAIAELLLMNWILNRAMNRGGGRVAVKAIVLLGCICMHLVPVVGAFAHDAVLVNLAQRWGNIFLGFTMFFFAVIAVFWILNLMAIPFRSNRKYEEDLSGEHQHGTAFGKVVLVLAFIVTIAANVYGMVHAYDVKVTKEEVGEGSRKVRIALIADLHMGVNSSPDLFRKMVAEVNSEKPDIILIAGDIMTSSYTGIDNPDEYAEVLGQMHARYGKYVVYGNHDVDEPLLGGFALNDVEQAERHAEMPAFIRKCGWKLLVDETADISEADIQIIGRRDAMRLGDGVEERMSLDKLMAKADKSKELILVQHEPRDLDKMNECGIGLAVAGHTHDGQIWPGNIITEKLSEHGYGMREFDGTYSAVTSGVGFYGPPLRIGTNSEVYIIDYSY